MIIHIKRFYFSERNMDYRKINEKFEFSRSFNLTSMQKQKGRYDLYGIVHHYGTKNGGHYVSECKDPNTNNWYLCDDESVTPISSGPDLTSSSAYLLFYYRSSMR